MNRKAREVEAVKCENSKQAATDGKKSHQNSDPEIFSKCETRWQSVLSVLAMLDPRHDQRGNRGNNKQGSFGETEAERRKARDADVSLRRRESLVANLKIAKRSPIPTVTAATSARKISTRHPARMPCGPRKTVFSG
jgi:hypothetical protein